MIKRALWLGVGIAVGALAVRKISKSMHSYSPTGLAGRARNSAADVVASVRDFVADVRAEMAEREAEIHSALEQGLSLDELDRLDHGDPEAVADERGADGRR